MTEVGLLPTPSAAQLGSEPMTSRSWNSTLHVSEMLILITEPPGTSRIHSCAWIYEADVRYQAASVDSYKGLNVYTRPVVN